MFLLATACALITAMLVAVVALWQRRRPADGLEHAKALYAAFVADVERREARGEIDAELGHEERVEAARALLKAESEAPLSPPVRPKLAAGLIFAAAAVTFALYMLFTGRPLIPDQPYKARLQAWTHAAQQNPDDVSPEVLAAVLRQGVDRNAKDPVFWTFLARKDMLAGHAYLAAKEFERAEALAPASFTAWSELGEALAFISGGKIGGDARAAFDKALAIDPADTRAHYYLGRMNLDAGRYDAARADFTAALSGLAPDDIRRTVVSEQLEAVDTAEKAEIAARARIAAMVAGLAAQLKADPENADGWARLLRSYDVLGDAAARAKAEADMKVHYRDRPQVAASILSRAQAAVGAENTGGQ